MRPTGRARNDHAERVPFEPQTTEERIVNCLFLRIDDRRRQGLIHWKRGHGDQPAGEGDPLLQRDWIDTIDGSDVGRARGSGCRIDNVVYMSRNLLTHHA